MVWFYGDKDLSFVTVFLFVCFLVIFIETEVLRSWMLRLYNPLPICGQNKSIFYSKCSTVSTLWKDIFNTVMYWNCCHTRLGKFSSCLSSLKIPYATQLLKLEIKSNSAEQSCTMMCPRYNKICHTQLGKFSSCLSPLWILSAMQLLQNKSNYAE